MFIFSLYIVLQIYYFIMSNSFNIDVKPEISAVSAKVDIVDTVVDLIRSTDVPVITGKVDTVDTVVDSLLLDLKFIVSPSNTEILASNTQRSVNSGTPTKKKEILIAVSGLYRITFDLRSENASYTVKGCIYKNGVAFGTEQSTTSITYVNKSEDLSFLSGDLLQLFIWDVSSAIYTFTQNLKIKGTLSASSSTVILD